MSWGFVPSYQRLHADLTSRCLNASGFNNGGLMFVRSFMSSPVVTLPSATRAIDALELMQAKKIRRIPVTEEGRLTGILTLGDIQSVLGLQEHSVRRAATRLGDIMTREVR